MRHSADKMGKSVLTSAANNSLESVAVTRCGASLYQCVPTKWTFASYLNVFTLIVSLVCFYLCICITMIYPVYNVVHGMPSDKYLTDLNVWFIFRIALFYLPICRMTLLSILAVAFKLEDEEHIGFLKSTDVKKFAIEKLYFLGCRNEASLCMLVYLVYSFLSMVSEIFSEVPLFSGNVHSSRRNVTVAFTILNVSVLKNDIFQDMIVVSIIYVLFCLYFVCSISSFKEGFYFDKSFQEKLRISSPIAVAFGKLRNELHALLPPNDAVKLRVVSSWRFYFVANNLFLVIFLDFVHVLNYKDIFLSEDVDAVQVSTVFNYTYFVVSFNSVVTLIVELMLIRHGSILTLLSHAYRLMFYLNFPIILVLVLLKTFFVLWYPAQLNSSLAIFVATKFLFICSLIPIDNKDYKKVKREILSRVQSTQQFAQTDPVVEMGVNVDKGSTPVVVFQQNAATSAETISFRLPDTTSEAEVDTTQNGSIPANLEANPPKINYKYKMTHVLAIGFLLLLSNYLLRKYFATLQVERKFSIVFVQISYADLIFSAAAAANVVIYIEHRSTLVKKIITFVNNNLLQSTRINGPNIAVAAFSLLYNIQVLYSVQNFQVIATFLLYVNVNNVINLVFYFFSDLKSMN